MNKEYIGSTRIINDDEIYLYIQYQRPVCLKLLKHQI